MQITFHFLIILAEIRPIPVEAPLARKYSQRKFNKSFQKLKLLLTGSMLFLLFSHFQVSNLPLLIPKKQIISARLQPKEMKFVSVRYNIWSRGREKPPSTTPDTVKLH